MHPSHRLSLCILIIPSCTQFILAGPKITMIDQDIHEVLIGSQAIRMVETVLPNGNIYKTMTWRDLPIPKDNYVQEGDGLLCAAVGFYLPCRDDLSEDHEITVRITMMRCVKLFHSSHGLIYQ